MQVLDSGFWNPESSTSHLVFDFMFIIDIHYIAPLEKIDAAMGQHMKFLNQCYRENLFLTSGRKVPRTGGIILAHAESKESLTELMELDPFCSMGLAEFTITEFQNSQMHPEFKNALKKISQA